MRYAAAGDAAYGNDLIQRYNLNYTIRDMFLPIGYLTPRRFRWDNSAGVWVRVLPWVKGVKGTVGTFTSINPQYMDPSYATHEEMIIHGMNPFGIYTRQDPMTLGKVLVSGLNQVTDSGITSSGRTLKHEMTQVVW